MAPIRRYLRITKYSVLECHIYLDNPALAQSWLLNPRDPVLPRVIESVRPLVLPKLLEEKERERTRKKGKKRSIKDVVVEDDFEVSVFLTETDIRHSLLYKRKLFRDKVQTRLTSNSSKLTGASREAPVDVEKENSEAGDVPILREEDEDGGQNAINLADIPSIHDRPGGGETTADSPPANRRRKRRRRGGMVDPRGRGSDKRSEEGGTDLSSADELFVGEQEGEGEEDERDSDEEAAPIRQPPSKRRKEGKAGGGGGGGDTERGGGRGEKAASNDDKKKLAMDISYEGFAIYGRVLCLVVKRRGDGDASTRGGRLGATAGSKPQTATATASARPGGQAAMENWIASTQLPETAAAEDGEAETL